MTFFKILLAFLIAFLLFCAFSAVRFFIRRSLEKAARRSRTVFDKKKK